MQLWQGDQTTMMDWQHEAPRPMYTLVQNAHLCEVWRTSDGTWGVVMLHEATTTAYSFQTREAAQTWCETRLAEITAKVDALKSSGRDVSDRIRLRSDRDRSGEDA